VVAPEGGVETPSIDDEAFAGEGKAVNSGPLLDGLPTAEAKKVVVQELEKKSRGAAVINYRLRDWVFSRYGFILLTSAFSCLHVYCEARQLTHSLLPLLLFFHSYHRQRYWGEPIPIYFPVDMPDHEKGDPRNDDPHTIRYDQPIAVEESELPLKLPEMDNFAPGNDPQGCLARAKDWRYFKKPDGKWYARETNTMPQWAGSCWYYLRFTDPTNTERAWSEEADRDWLPVDLYVGGQEHAVLHLLYARFWHKFLFDEGLTKHKEPFQKLVHQGMILGSDGEKMSKSRGNVVNPDDVVSEFGGDALRLYEMFMGPLEAVKPWQTAQVAGVVRFRDKVYQLVKNREMSKKPEEIDNETLRLMHKTIKKVTQDVETLSFNTAISTMMIFANHLSAIKGRALPRAAVENLVLLVSPFAPHLGEECWELLGHQKSLSNHAWPQYQEELTVDDVVTLGVQVNGKTRGEVSVAVDAKEADVMALATTQDKVAGFLEGKNVVKVIYVPGRILNIVVK
jgi:leucyl-tRNA synthetase